MFEVHICGFFQIQCLDGAYLSQILRYLPKKSIIMTFACFISTACISTSQMCLLKSFVPPSMLAVLVRLKDRGCDSGKRRCQIKVQFECGVKTKFLAPIFQSMTSISDYQSIPRSHSFQNMYNTYMCKMHLKGEK